MKKLIVFILLLSAQLIAAQAKIYQQEEVDVKPNFPGGYTAYYEFLHKNFRLKATEKRSQSVIGLEFIVQTTGALTDIKISNPRGTAAEAEAMRVMALSPKWLPASLKGKAVSSRFVLMMANPYADYYENVGIDNEPAATGSAPTPEDIEKNDNEIYNTAGIEVPPDFPGGRQKFYDFFNKTFHLPEEEDLKGKIVMSFVVEKDGSLSDIRVLRDIGYDTGKEAVRVIKSSPKWNPGMQNGKKVRCLYTLPFPIENAAKTSPEKK